MNKKGLKMLEKFLDERFPTASIHVRADEKYEFVISGEGIAESPLKEQVWKAAEEYFGGGVEWGKPHFGDA